MDYVIDSGVFAKLLINEADSEKAENLIAKIIENPQSYIVVPDIFMYEVIGIFKKYKLTNDAINDFVSMYDQKYITIFPLDKMLINKALEMTTKGHEKSGYPSFYDSVYHVLAIQNNCDFITADKKHFEKVKYLGHIKYFEDL